MHSVLAPGIEEKSENQPRVNSGFLERMVGTVCRPRCLPATSPPAARAALDQSPGPPLPEITEIHLEGRNDRPTLPRIGPTETLRKGAPYQAHRTMNQNCESISCPLLTTAKIVKAVKSGDL